MDRGVPLPVFVTLTDVAFRAFSVITFIERLRYNVVRAVEIFGHVTH